MRRQGKLEGGSGAREGGGGGGGGCGCGGGGNPFREGWRGGRLREGREEEEEEEEGKT